MALHHTAVESKDKPQQWRRWPCFSKFGDLFFVTAMTATCTMSRPWIPIMESNLPKSSLWSTSKPKTCHVCGVPAACSSSTAKPLVLISSHSLKGFIRLIASARSCAPASSPLRLIHGWSKWNPNWWPFHWRCAETKKKIPCEGITIPVQDQADRRVSSLKIDSPKSPLVV